MSLPHLIVVTGTDTGVGKTIVTAALCAVLSGAGRRVVAYKPCQTGAADGDSDADEVVRLAAPDQSVTGAVLQAPLAPVIAARLEGAGLPTVASHADRIQALGRDADHVIVEGSGGLLVELDLAGGTIADLARLLDAPLILVTRPALGTLNHTALTLEAAQRRHVAVLGLVIGSWPADPGEAEAHNRREFESGSPPLLGTIPAGASSLMPETFRSRAGAWLDGLYL